MSTADWSFTVDFTNLTVDGRPPTAEQRARMAHLLDDAPFRRCDRCGRSTWTVEEFGAEDRVTQPDGNPCGGRFGEEDARG